MSRVSTAQTFDTTIDRLTRRQAELTDAQERMSSGKRVTRASDDPAAAARAERALASTSKITATKRGVEASQSVMQQTESALGDANDLMGRARELMVAAGNPALSDSERQSMGKELSGLRQELIGVANRSDGGDGYLFGGTGSLQPPFVNGAGGIQYAGDGGRLSVGDTPLPLSFGGSDGWMNAPTGNGVYETRVVTRTGTGVIDGGSVIDAAAFHALPPSNYDIDFTVTSGTNGAPDTTSYVITRTPLPPAAAVPVIGTPQTFTNGQAIQVDGMSFNVNGKPATGDQFQIVPSANTLSAFDAIDKAIGELTTPGRTSTDIAQGNAENLRNFDSVMSRMQLARSDAGNALNLIDGTRDRLDGQALQSETERSSAEDLDMVAAISDFQNKQSGYDAALKSYAMVQKMSLFQYLNA